jgi:hypothetical protein
MIQPTRIEVAKKFETSYARHGSIAEIQSQESATALVIWAFSAVPVRAARSLARGNRYRDRILALDKVAG